MNAISEGLPTGDHIAEYFDLIAGTSTGGIIGIGLGLELSPKRILELYTEDGSKIFPPFWTRNGFLRFIRRLFTSLYNHQALESLLRAEFESKRLGDSICRLVIPAFTGPKAQVAVFKTDHHPDFKTDWTTPAWQVARATSAAPTFFAGHSYDDSYFLDGGVWANNPVMLAIVEAVSAYQVPIDRIRVLPIGTGNLIPTIGQGATRAGMLGWRDIITTAMYLTTDTALSQARLLLGSDAVIRLQPTEVGAAIQLNDWKRAKDVLPGEAQAALLQNAAHIRAFFETKVEPRERHKGR
jgi:patatin-like phospholipase/acyl hydrolase